MFVAGVIYKKISENPSIWRPIKAAPILAWVLRHKDHKQMAIYLHGAGRKRGWTWEWLR